MRCGVIRFQSHQDGMLNRTAISHPAAAYDDGSNNSAPPLSGMMQEWNAGSPSWNAGQWSVQ
jgi:hypothetical protein